MRTILFYRTAAGHSPVEEFLETLNAKQARKVYWLLNIVENSDILPAQYFKKLAGTDLWEVRAQFSGSTFRFLGFMDGGNLVVLVSAFAKKSEKTPQHEIERAEERIADYLRRRRKR